MYVYRSVINRSHDTHTHTHICVYVCVCVCQFHIIRKLLMTPAVKYLPQNPNIHTFSFECDSIWEIKFVDHRNNAQIRELVCNKILCMCAWYPRTHWRGQYQKDGEPFTRDIVKYCDVLRMRFAYTHWQQDSWGQRRANLGPPYEILLCALQISCNGRTKAVREIYRSISRHRYFTILQGDS